MQVNARTCQITPLLGYFSLCLLGKALPAAPTPGTRLGGYSMAGTRPSTTEADSITEKPHMTKNQDTAWHEPVIF